MKKILPIILATILISIFILIRPRPKYIYANRENISTNQDGSISFDLYCYHEYSDGHIKKNYLETLTTYTITNDVTRIKSNQCKQTPNLF